MTKGQQSLSFVGKSLAKSTDPFSTLLDDQETVRVALLNIISGRHIKYKWQTYVIIHKSLS